jgi:hypothetical protein
MKSLAAILALATLAASSCAPIKTPGGYRETYRPERRSFTVISSEPVEPSKPGALPYRVTRITNVTVR